MAKLTTKEKETQARRVKKLLLKALGKDYTFQYNGGSDTRNQDGYLDRVTRKAGSRSIFSEITC